MQCCVLVLDERITANKHTNYMSDALTAIDEVLVFARPLSYGQAPKKVAQNHAKTLSKKFGFLGGNLATS